MPVSTDFGEPPAKCCKYCDESTHGVDGPVSWRLTLDQDLIDTLKGSFPSWFSNTSTGGNNNNSNNNLNVSTEKPLSVNLTPTVDGMAEGERPTVQSATSAPPMLGVVEGTHTTLNTVLDSRQSPPKAVVDSSPLQPAMDKNKESLKVKLMVRRPITQLVEQGIMPPLKTSPAIHEQRKQLERAKTGDLLKAKIQQRPDRQELERRHILEHEESHVDPSLAEKQRMLKKARLADQLNSQISHRPGPLELIKKNILHTEEPIERIVKEGLVSFKATSEGLLNRPQQPNSYITFEEDSQSSEGDQRCSPVRSDVIEAAAASAGIVTVALTIPTSGGAVVVTSAPVLQNKFHSLFTSPYVSPPPPPPPLPIKTETIQIKSETPQRFAELCQSVVGPLATSPTLLPIAPAPSPASLGSTTSSLSPLSSVSSPPSAVTPRPVQSPLPPKTDAPGKDKYRKKSKSKPTAKTRTIKFHEYKGPPNAQKSSSQTAAQAEETSYQLLLKQQNFLLEYLEGLHKHPNILPANQKPLILTEANFVQNHNNNIIQPLPSPAASVSSSIPASPAPSFTEISASELNKLEKMKVSDLKLLLKKRNLPVSGPKPQLIERLKPFLPLDNGDAVSTSESISGETCDLDAVNSPRHSLSPESEHENMDVQQVDSPPFNGRITPAVTNDDLVREQQRKIDELQRKLKESQEELLHMKQIQTTPTPAPVSNTEQRDPINQKLVFKQQLEAKIQKEKMQQIENLQRQRKEQLASQQQAVKNQATNIFLSANANPVNAIIAAKEEPPTLTFNENQLQQLANKKNVEIVWNGESTLFLVGLQDKKLVNGHQRAASMPSILVPITAAPAQVEALQVDSVATIQSQQPVQQMQVDMKPPPQYEEATKQLQGNNKNNKTEGKPRHRNSQLMTDVLEILIKNGELPASAAQVPVTPTTPGNVVMTENMVFQASQVARDTPTFTDSLPASLILQPNTGQNVQNMELLSPIQPESHIDNDNAVKTLDIFLGQSQSQPDLSSSDSRDSNATEINHFDDLELMELMSHQLDMDIGDDSCQQPQFSIESSSMRLNNGNNGNSGRRDPSLQPSLNELIQQQQQQQNHSQSNGYNNFSLSNNNLSNINNNFHDTPMDVEDFSSSLSSFDFSTLSGVQDNQIDTPPHPFSLSVAQSTGHLQNGISDSDTYDPHLSINHDNILDLFNIDDFRMSGESMSWGEVDFAV